MIYIRYTNKEVRERPFTKADVIATARQLLRDQTPKGERVPDVCLSDWNDHEGPFNYPEFNDQVHACLDASWYYHR